MYLTRRKSHKGQWQYGVVERFLLGTADLVMEVLGEPEGTLFDYDDDCCNNVLPSECCLLSDDETSRDSGSDNELSKRSICIDLLATAPVKEIVVTTTTASAKRHAMDYLTDRLFHLAGLVFAFCMAMMLRCFLQTIGTDTGVGVWEECRDALRLVLAHNHGIPFLGMLVFMKLSRHIVNAWIYQPVLVNIYEGTNEKFASNYCEWLLEAVKKTTMFAIGVSVALGSDWVPRPALPDTWLWIPKQGGTIFDSHGDIVPTCAIALETIGHLEVVDDFVSLIVLLYDHLVEWLDTTGLSIHHRGKDDEQPKKKATTTTSFAEDFVHHTGVLIAAFFIYIVAKDNCNAVPIVILLAQLSDLFEYSILVLGLCKNWYLERIVTPTLLVLWTISVLYIWPAASIPLALEPIPIEHSLDSRVIVSLTIYQIACVLISLLFWAMHVLWLYKSVIFLYKYHSGVYSKLHYAKS